MPQDSFEENLKKIDEIIKSLNSLDQNLMQSIEEYKKGISLIKQSRKILQDATLQIKEIDLQDD